MIRPLLVRGMVAGLVAGVLAFAFAFAVGEPQIQRAIAFEEQLAALHHEAAEAEIVTRGTQATWGLLTGTVLMGVALGGLFSLVFAYAYGRMGQLRPRATAGLLALGAFVTIILVPFTKYPPNPPTVGAAETIDQRTILFMVMIAASILAAIAADRLRRNLLPRLGPWNASIVAVVVFLAVIIVVELLLPSVQETPAGFPADLLYNFRVASLGLNAVLWTAIGLGFGAAAERLIVGTRAPT